MTMASAANFVEEAALGGRQPTGGALTYEMDVFRVIAQRAVRAVKGVEKIHDGRSGGLISAIRDIRTSSSNRSPLTGPS